MLQLFWHFLLRFFDVWYLERQMQELQRSTESPTPQQTAENLITIWKQIINPSQVCLARNLYKPPWNKQQVVTPKPKKQSSESRGFLGLFKVGMMFFLEIRDLQREFVWSLTGKGITPLTRASSCRADDVVNALLTSRASPNASHGW